MEQEQNQNDNPCQCSAKLEGLLFVKQLGKAPGPTKRNGQKTFSIIFGLFDIEGNQATHTKADGTEIALVLTSYPIDTDELPNSGLYIPK